MQSILSISCPDMSETLTAMLLWWGTLFPNSRWKCKSFCFAPKVCLVQVDIAVLSRLGGFGAVCIPAAQFLG